MSVRHINDGRKRERERKRESGDVDDKTYVKLNKCKKVGKKPPINVDRVIAALINRFFFPTLLSDKHIAIVTNLFRYIVLTHLILFNAKIPRENKFLFWRKKKTLQIFYRWQTATSRKKIAEWKASESGRERMWKREQKQTVKIIIFVYAHFCIY